MTNRQAAIRIIRVLRKSGHQALLAGGCVRDMLLGKRPKDYDVATDARPKDVVKLFRRTLTVGAKFGVVIVLIDKAQVEVATFRTESGYADGRHPDSVAFSSAKEDASRRDFTINGMFYDPITGGVVDYVRGRKDLNKQVIRTIGDASERFAEDYLRMLRAVRFSTRLGFRISRMTQAAICSHAEKITAVSGERICVELQSILADPNRGAGAKLLVKTGLADAIFPGYCDGDPKFAGKVLGHLRKKTGFPLALAAFFTGCAAEKALEMCRLLKLSRNQTKHVKFLLTHRGRLLDNKMSVADLKRLLANPYFWDLYELQRAIQKALGRRNALSPLIKLRRRITALGDVDVKPEPLLNGHDLIHLGATPGPSLGQLTEELYTAQLEGTLKTRAQAEKWAAIWLEDHRN